MGLNKITIVAGMISRIQPKLLISFMHSGMTELGIGSPRPTYKNKISFGEVFRMVTTPDFLLHSGT